jgi:hypothetical protein
VIKIKMVALDSSFDERNYGCRSFRDFLDRFPAASGKRFQQTMKNWLAAQRSGPLRRRHHRGTR